MLEKRGIEFEYREYRDDPLSEAKIRDVLARLGVGPREVLRTRDRAARDAGLTGQESDDRLIALMARHPTLLQRPIGIVGDRAVLGRPAKRLLDLVD